MYVLCGHTCSRRVRRINPISYRIVAGLAGLPDGSLMTSRRGLGRDRKTLSTPYTYDPCRRTPATPRPFFYVEGHIICSVFETKKNKINKYNLKNKREREREKKGTTRRLAMAISTGVLRSAFVIRNGNNNNNNNITLR